MKGRTPTAAEKQFMNRICALGCIVCHEHLNVFTEASPHHMVGKTVPDAHFKVLPLCSRHHQIKSNDKLWVSRHGDGQAAFEKAYGTELYLYQRCIELLFHAELDDLLLPAIKENLA